MTGNRTSDDEHYQGDLRLSVASMLASEELMESIIKESPESALGVLETLLRIPPESFKPRFMKHVVSICKGLGSPIADAALDSLINQLNSVEALCHLIDYAKQTSLINIVADSFFELPGNGIPKPFTRNEWLRVHRLLCEHRREGMMSKSSMIESMLDRMGDDGESLSTRLEVSVQFWNHLGSTILVTKKELLSALADKSCQKNAKWILKQRISKCSSIDKISWDAWFQLYDAIDEYSSHLFKSVFGNIINNLTIVSTESTSEFFMTRDIVFLLIERCLNHDNDHVVKHTVLEIMESESIRKILFDKRIIDEDSLDKFLSLIEKRCIVVFQRSEYANGMKRMLCEWTKQSARMNKKLLSRVLDGKAKMYFPIIHCYLSSAQPVAEPKEILDSISHFATRSVLQFPGLLRRCLLLLLESQVAQFQPSRAQMGRFLKTCDALKIPKRALAINSVDAIKFLNSVLVSKEDFAWLEFGMLDYASSILSKHGIASLRTIVQRQRKFHRHEIPVDQYRRILMVEAALNRHQSRSSIHALSIPLKTLDSLLWLKDDSVMPELSLWVERFHRDVDQMNMEAFERIFSSIKDCVDNLIKVYDILPREIMRLTVGLTFLSRLPQTKIWPLRHSTKKWILNLMFSLFAFSMPRKQISPDLTIPILPALENTTREMFCRLDSMESVFEQFDVSRWEFISCTIHQGLDLDKDAVIESIFDSENFVDDLVDCFDSLSSETVLIYNEIVLKLFSCDNLIQFLFEHDFHKRYLETAGAHLLVPKKQSQFSTKALSSIVSTISVACDRMNRFTQKPFSDFFSKLLKSTSVDPQTARIVAKAIAQLLVESSKYTPYPSYPALIKLVADFIVYREDFDENDIEGKLAVENEEAEAIDLTSACSRTIVLIALSKSGDSKMMEKIIVELLKKIREFQQDMVRKNAPLTPLPFSPFHRMQLRVFQALCYLAPKISESTWTDVVFPDVFDSILKWPNQPDSRDYLEILVIYGMMKLPSKTRAAMISQWVIPALTDHTLPSQSVASFVLVGGYLVSHGGESSVELVVKTIQLVHALIPYLSSNISYIRGVSQQWLLEASNRGVLSRLGCASDVCIQSFLGFIKSNKEAVAMRQRLVLIYNEWDPIEVVASGKILTLCKSGAMFKNGEFLPSWIFMESIKYGVHEALENNWFYTRDMEQYLDDGRDKSEVGNNQTVQNAQRKYDPSLFGHIFPGAVESCESLESRRRQSATDLIVVTTLVEKTTNIAGLFRSAEVFGARKIVIASKCILRDPDFKSMAVTADKWIDFEEVAPSNLAQFIQRMQREEGYTAVCLEQTHQSVKIGDYKFPKKTLLILGNEKSGVDAEYLHLMDVCVEIPQKGVIRSLNVHVSGALAIWEYNQSI